MTLVFDEREAAEIGLNEAIILNQMRYWFTRPHPDNAERDWIWNSYDQWQEQFPFWSKRTIQRAILSLENQGMIVSEQRGLKHGVSHKYYRLSDNVAQGVVPNWQGGSAKLASPSCQNGTMYNEHKTTTETTTETTIYNPKNRERAVKFNALIRNKFAEHHLTLTAKLTDEATCKVLDQLERLDGVQVATELWQAVNWSWTHQLPKGALYGSVLGSPKEWRTNGKILKCINMYKQAMRADVADETRKLTNDQYYGGKPAVRTPDEQAAERATAEARERTRLADLCARAGVPFPDCPVEMETDWDVIFEDGTSVPKLRAG